MSAERFGQPAIVQGIGPEGVAISLHLRGKGGGGHGVVSVGSVIRRAIAPIQGKAESTWL